MPNMNITYKTMPQCEHNKIIQLHIYKVEIQKSNKVQQKNEDESITLDYPLWKTDKY